MNIIELNKALINNIQSTKWISKQLDIYDSINKNLDWINKVNKYSLSSIVAHGKVINCWDSNFASNDILSWYPDLSYETTNSWCHDINAIPLNEWGDEIIDSNPKRLLFRKEQKRLQYLIEKYKETKEIKYYFLAKKILDNRKQALLESIYQNKKQRRYIHRKLESISGYSFRLSYIRNIIRNHIKNTNNTSNDEDEINNSSITQLKLFFINRLKFETLCYKKKKLLLSI